MATIKQLVGTEKAEQIFALKDTLKRERSLSGDPMNMNRTQFEAYMAAKAEALIVDQTCKGVDADEAFTKAHLYLTVLDRKWRAAAKAHNEAHTS